ncbi:type I polyketide synthase [Actinophytocola gossypii]|uniref:SDR family NAD(P)-dependent oxidoreductase n=1 Tax=Actinophytocola gossypii TaxID=2812003 RepID=A0ABT2J7C5_9PSEU|nr:type I polyketide synthase [Actinophytocola gossypii]MCT2583757.1 SDR family NAD(P)-dependent oxidoreductase [Actinophytocola gossypii]
MSNERIAIVGIGLRYPDATSPEELWENVLAGRRAFRRLPDVRMNQADYWSPDPHAPDRFYSTRAAVLRDFEFDRVKYKIAGSTYRSTDLTHWLALDTAATALADAGFPFAEGLPRRGAGVILGNSLTGEFSRANLMRLRWPYVRRTVAAALSAKGWSAEETGAFLRDLEPQYKAPFPPIDEDTLAGGLANTIAGRICNYFDLGGGGFTVDGACSSSLLAITSAARALVDGDLDVAIAGGVDLSIDPFEVIGFAKTGALATGEMKVYDKDSNGFWPGEGCGMVVLMRESEAIARNLRIYASVTGWGVSSDGKGGITRPEASGHQLALTRAYERAGYGVETVSYFEGHGTGTAVGDATEIEALSGARREADPTAPPAALGTIKGNFGHTKAAAGIAGLIKATLAVYHQVIPPATGHVDPHPKLTEPDAAMYVPDEAGLWPADGPVRAGVSAMGFGGINSHVAIEEAPGRERRTEVDRRAGELVAGRQDVELLLVDAHTHDALHARVANLVGLVGTLATAELTDLAGTLAVEQTGGHHRAAVVAGDPADAVRKLTRVRDELAAGTTRLFAPADGVFLDHRTTAPRIAYLFPGQGSGRDTVGAIRRRFTAARTVFANEAVPADGDHVATEVAQPRIVAGSVAGLRVLYSLGIDADIAVGHSLGELTALSWAGAIEGGDVLRLAAVRGRVMGRASRTGGAMAGVSADPATVEALAGDRDVVVAGYNGPTQTVIAGPASDVDEVCVRARSRGLTATRLNVSHAFHSPMVRPAAEAMAERLTEFDLGTPRRPVVSTVTGELLEPHTDLRALLVDQVVRPVRFQQAAAVAVAGADLVLEVGPGRVLSGLVAQQAPDTAVLALDTDSPSLSSLLGAAGAAYALGVDLDPTPLFADRVVRPMPEDADLTFLASPCETAPEIAEDLTVDAEPADATDAAESTDADAVAAGSSESATLDVLRRLAADRVELPLETVTAQTHPLDDLHLSSITVGQIVNEATRELGLPALAATANFATVTLGELAEMIDQLDETAQDGAAGPNEIPGFAPWVRPFSVDYLPAPRTTLALGTGAPGNWELVAPAGHPLGERLRAALVDAGVGNGVLLCLPRDGEPHVELFLRAGQRAVAGTDTRFVVVQENLGASGLARTLHLEHPSVPTTVIGLADSEPTSPEDIDATVANVVGDVAATTGFAEVRYTEEGTRTVPVLRALPDVAPDGTTGAASPLGPGDVLLVTGGAKGITAECALAMARDSGARLALLGRADPAEDDEVSTNLARMASAGVEVRYERADVTAADQVLAAVTRFENELGPVTALLHGAGRNEPSALANLTDEQFRQTLAPKIAGLRTVLGAVDADRIKLLVTFGSIIGRAGLRGEAHYSTANDWMSELTVRFGEEHPNARVLALEWSVWSGAGMGEKLGVVEALMRDGITPISLDNGLAVLRRVLADPSAGPVLVVSGRAAGLPTLAFASEELPLTRFIDRVPVHYPGVELISETELSAGSDPYLSDHLLEGDLLFPAVIGMEAMTQVATALTGRPSAPLLEEVEFLRPIVVRPGGSTGIRIVALNRDAETVAVAIRSEETAFSSDHFRARLRFPRPEPPTPAAGTTGIVTNLPAVPVDPVAELYGGVLFQGKRFQRLLSYRRASARHAVAELSTTTPAPWFAAFLSQERVLADPGTRDAVMHAIQCCVPDATLLPQGIEKLYLADPDLEADTEVVVMDARERLQDGDTYVYDIDVLTTDGTLVERWEGLSLRAVRKRAGAGPWVPALLGSYLERAAERVLGGSRAVVVEPNPATGLFEAEDRRAQTALAAGRALGRVARVRYRPDGRPEIDDAALSASHGAGVTMVVTGTGPLACDVETVLDRDGDDWATLLGEQQVPVCELVAAETGESLSLAATRVWSALECLRKAGVTAQALTLDRVDEEGWVLLSDGDARIATWVTTLNDVREPVVFAVLSGEEN